MSHIKTVEPLHSAWMYAESISGWDLNANHVIQIFPSPLLLPLSIGWKCGYVTRKGLTEKTLAVCENSVMGTKHKPYTANILALLMLNNG